MGQISRAAARPGGVFAEADDIQAASIEVPSLVTERILDEQEAPRDVVQRIQRRGTNLPS